MKIGGFQQQTLVDYPGRISSVVFTQGCNFRCPFCHNSTLVLPDRIGNSMDEDKVINYFKTHLDLLDAVVITGGEPTLQTDLKEFIQKIKDIGLEVKLDTNGTNPKIIKELIDEKLINFIAMDIKAPFEEEKYQTLTGGAINPGILSKIQKTINIIKESGINHEFRTTIIKELHTKDDINSICSEIPKAQRYSLQKFNPQTVLKKELKFFNPYTDKEMQEMMKNLEHDIQVLQLK